MTKIFFNSIRYVQQYHLLSTEELVAFCEDFNSKIAIILRQNVSLVVWNTYDILFVTNKSYARLIIEWFVYTIPMVLLRIFIPRWRIRFQLTIKYITNKMEWKYKKHLSSIACQTVFHNQYN